MATQVAGLSRRGLSDWVVQRVTAVLLAIYTLVIVGFFVTHADVTYALWKAFFDQTWIRVFTLIAIISICAHAWIGMWTIGTDYIQAHYFGRLANSIRFVYEVICGMTLLGYLIWSLKILWG